MRVSASEISFVVQGPVVHAANGGTRQVCASIRRFFPGAEIIVSTWEGTDTRGLDADQTVLSPDPGPLIPGRNLNLNRHIVSSYEGIRRATRRLVMKTRSDILFTSDSVLDYWDRWNDFAPDLRLFQKRVLVPNTFTFKPTYFNGHAFHPSDWCFLGLREDVEFLFDIPLCPLENLLVASPPDSLVTWKWSEPYAERHSNEQYLWITALQKRFPELTMQMFAHLTPENLPQTELAFANNLVVLNAGEQFGIFAPKYPDAETVFVASNLLNHKDWQSLYDAYCAAPSPGLPACTLDDVRAGAGDSHDWTDSDPRFTSLRRAGHAWEAMLLDCALRVPADMRGCNVEMLMGTEHTVDNALALALWAKAHLAARLAPSPAPPPLALSFPAFPSLKLPPSISSDTAEELHTTKELHTTEGLQDACASALTIQENEEGAAAKPGAYPERVGVTAQSDGIFAPGLAAWQQRSQGQAVTVCMMARPGEPFTKQCLESMARQTCPNMSFLLFLNGYMEDAPAWLPGFLHTHPEFVIARSSRHLPAADVWNYCFTACMGAYVAMAGAGDLLNRTCIEELAAAMRAHPHIAVGRAALVQGMANGPARFLPLKRADAVLSAGDTVIAGLHHGAFTRSPSVQIFCRDMALQSPALCDARFNRYALEEFALRLMIPGGLVYRAGRCGVRLPAASVSMGVGANAQSEKIERYRQECALKIHVLQEFTRTKTLSYNRVFVGMLLLRMDVLGLVDCLEDSQAAGGNAREQAALRQIYQDAAADLRVITLSLDVRAHEEAVASYECGDTVQALAQLESLVADSPYFGPAHNDLSLLLYHRGDIAGALEHSKQAVAIMPQAPDALRNMACILAASSRKADAVQAYQRLLGIVPNDRVARQALAALCSQTCTGLSPSAFLAN